MAIDLKVGAVNPTGKAFAEEFESFYARERQSVVGLAYVLSGSR